MHAVKDLGTISERGEIREDMREFHEDTEFLRKQPVICHGRSIDPSGRT